jgi:hypothetical protein
MEGACHCSQACQQRAYRARRVTDRLLDRVNDYQHDRDGEHHRHDEQHPELSGRIGCAHRLMATTRRREP